MKADGCFDAYTQNDKGDWVYDWTKDSRFDLFAKVNGDVSKVSP